MITSPLVFLFIVALFATIFSYKLSYLSIFFLYLYIFFLKKINFLIYTQEIYLLINLTIQNIMPAMLFLFFSSFNIQELLNTNKFGCACNLGAKKYWLIISLSLFFSFISQFLAFYITTSLFPVISNLIAIFFGIVASKTSFYYLNGIREIFKTMLFVVSILIAIKQ